MDQDQKPNLLPNGQSGPQSDKSERLRKITQLGTDFVNVLVKEVNNEFEKSRKSQSEFKTWCHQRCENVNGRVKELEVAVKELQKQVAVKNDVIKVLEAKFEQQEGQTKAKVSRPSSTQTESTHTKTNLESDKEEKLDRHHSGFQLPQNQAARSSGPVSNQTKSPVPALHPMSEALSEKFRGDQRPGSALEALLNKIPQLPDRYRQLWEVKTESAATTVQNSNSSLGDIRKRKASDGGFGDLLHPDLPKRKRPTFGQRQEMINCTQAKIDAGLSEGSALLSIFNDPKFKDWGEKTIQGVWYQRDEIREILKTKPHLKDKKNIKRVSEATSRSESEDDSGLPFPMPSYTPWLQDYFQFYNNQK